MARGILCLELPDKIDERKILDTSRIGLWRVEMEEGKPVRFYADAQENLGKVLSKVYYPDPEAVAQLKRLRTEDIAVDYECVINKGYPGECHIMAKTKSVRIPDGQRMMVTTFLDVSDMMMLKKALHQAEEGSRAKSAFLFAMSHDLRKPMNAIIGYSDLMERHWEDRSVTWDYLQKMKLASQFLLSLIGNVLELSRIESGKESLHEAAWDLNGLNETLDVMVEGEITRKHLFVTRDIQLVHPHVICDSMKLRETLMNFLSNAVKYTPEGGHIHLNIEEKPSGKQGYGQFCISVQDNGIGIAKEYIPHLFEAFSREQDSADSGIMGTRLGLKIVRSFVDLMGGDISVESTPGKGSCFKVELLLRFAGEAEENLRNTEEPEILLEGKRILLAEDNRLNAEITATILEDAGIKTEVARDGAEAVAMLKKAPVGYYELILMDVQMPKLNGYEETKTIRKLKDERAKIPVIAITANAFEEDRRAALESGMDGYASKPIETEKLLKVIGNVLD